MTAVTDKNIEEFGALSFIPAQQALHLVADSTKNAILSMAGPEVWVSEIDPDLSDTAAFCEHYGIGMDVSANCVVIEARRADKVWYAACVILATDRIDVNGAVRRDLDARKASFAPMDVATELTQMQYGGITPLGLPQDWPILIDSRVMQQEKVVIGSGMRGSKLLVIPATLAQLSNAKVVDIMKAEITNGDK